MSLWPWLVAGGIGVLLLARKAEARVVMPSNEDNPGSPYNPGSPDTSDPATRWAAGGDFMWPLPVPFTFTSPFGTRVDPITHVAGAFHNGVDLAAPEGTPIYAPGNGVVLFGGFDNLSGNYLAIQHDNGYETRYAHMAQPAFVSQGEQVGQGQNIGVVGTTGKSTGAHLHFILRIGGQAVDPLSVFGPLTLGRAFSQFGGPFPLAVALFSAYEPMGVESPTL
jgi:murein DD-endopeptidase MepM/ murein hydrolase activator NlpD